MITLNDRDTTVIYKMLKYCGVVEKSLEHFGKSFENFKNDEVFRSAVSMPIFQIGELTSHLSDDFKTNHSEIPWQVIRAMRNWFAHNYDGMDIMKIWEAAVDDIPVLRKFCEDILNEDK